ncbi:energy transducer TonB [Mucilaginibacter paludis]|uniref:TonB family protein n=1 Tax=Mucilaginibacter paludis DSM 18603 TaxID=714943 RepID=H1Y301_9SPHI|nr:energy transducer TonB [Mucilaginibacter paludis]EHQ28546.1 TonB family protein [Mucilaginibacter paludis DSM 18603]
MEPFQKIQLSFKCPKSINELQPCSAGWHCDSCQKMVYDFRGMTETEILEAFRKSGAPLCGLYDAVRFKTIPKKPQWYKWASAAMIVFGLTSCQNEVMGKALKLPPEKAAKVDTIQNEAFFGMVAEIAPSFPGGQEALKKYLRQHIKNTSDFQGRAFVQFIVEKNGSLTNIQIIRSAGKHLDEQIIRAIKNMPKWNPGLNNGKPSRMQYSIPVNLSL